MVLGEETAADDCHSGSIRHFAPLFFTKLMTIIAGDSRNNFDTVFDFLTFTGRDAKRKVACPLIWAESLQMAGRAMVQRLSMTVNF
ncbi:MAG TPA: hypothetical protein VGM59_12385 [Dongiaceae bacterium]|jgi:hypothetical protein